MRVPLGTACRPDSVLSVLTNKNSRIITYNPGSFGEESRRGQGRGYDNFLWSVRSREDLRTVAETTIICEIGEHA